MGQRGTIPSTGFAGLSSVTKEVSLELQSVVSTLEESKRVFPVSVTEGLRLADYPVLPGAVPVLYPKSLESLSPGQTGTIGHYLSWVLESGRNDHCWEGVLSTETAARGWR